MADILINRSADQYLKICLQISRSLVDKLSRFVKEIMVVTKHIIQFEITLYVEIVFVIKSTRIRIPVGSDNIVTYVLG